MAKGLLFEAVRSAIAKADWYQKGYLANYVTYTLAKLAFEVGRQAGGVPSTSLGSGRSKQYLTW